MKTKAFTFITLAAALIATAACTNDDNNLAAVDNNTPVAARITAAVTHDAVATPSAKAGQPSTRAVGDRWNRDNIGVIVTSSPASDMATRYRNAHYATTSINVTANFAPTDAANTIYFADPDETVAFWAYAPYQPSATPGELPGANGVVTIDATGQAAPDGQEAIDFITATATASKASPTVAFKFRHIMSRLVLKIETPAAYGFSPNDVNRISGISLGGLCTGGTFDFNTRLHAFDPDTRTAEWNIDGYMHTVGPDKNGVLQRTHTLIFFPQQARDMNGGDLNAVPITITLDGKKYKNEKDLKGDLTAPGNFSSGKSYEYTIRLKKQDLEVTGATINNWEAGGSSSGDAIPTE